MLHYDIAGSNPPGSPPSFDVPFQMPAANVLRTQVRHLPEDGLIRAPSG